MGALNTAADTLFYNTYYLLDTALQHGMTIHDFGEAEQAQIAEWISLNYKSSFIAGNVSQMAGWKAGKVSIEQWPSGKRGNQEAEDEPSQSSVTAYPVPFTDFVVIEFTEPLPQGSFLVLTDMTGRVVQSVELRALETRSVLVTSGLPSGFYSCRVFSGSSLVGMVKLVKG